MRDLLSSRFPLSFSDESRRIISDLFMEAVSGHRLGAFAMSKATEMGHKWPDKNKGDKGGDNKGDNKGDKGEQAAGGGHADAAASGALGAPPSPRSAGSGGLGPPPAHMIRGKAAREAKIKEELAKAQQQHIDTARMDYYAFVLFIGLLLEEHTPSPNVEPPKQLQFLAERMWSDATEGFVLTAKAEAAQLSFQDLLRYLGILNLPDFQTRAAFMFDLFDKDDSGSITMRELGDIIQTAAPNSIVEMVGLR